MLHVAQRRQHLYNAATDAHERGRLHNHINDRVAEDRKLDLQVFINTIIAPCITIPSYYNNIGFNIMILDYYDVII